MNVAVHISLQSCHINMMNPNCRSGDICAVLAVWVRRGVRFSNDPCVDFMRLLLGSITWVSFAISFLLLHGLFTLM